MPVNDELGKGLKRYRLKPRDGMWWVYDLSTNKWVEGYNKYEDALNAARWLDAN